MERALRLRARLRRWIGIFAVLAVALAALLIATAGDRDRAITALVGAALAVAVLGFLVLSAMLLKLEHLIGKGS